MAARSYTSLKTQLEDWVTESEDRMLAVFRASVQDVVDEAQMPVAKGGKMRVDTGFLRASGAGQVGSMPSGPAIKPTNATPGQFGWSQDNVTAALAKVKYGDTFYFGWSANYARYRELYDGFMEAPLMQWGSIVAANVAKLKQRVEK